jgi:hypothetical protein
MEQIIQKMPKHLQLQRAWFLPAYIYFLHIAGISKRNFVHRTEKLNTMLNISFISYRFFTLVIR